MALLVKSMKSEPVARRVSSTTIHRLRNRFPSGALAWNVGNTPPTLAHELRNEVVPWCESAPQLQLGTPREKTEVDRGFPVPALRLGLVMQMTRKDGPN